MSQDLFLQLAASGLRMPIGTDLVLHEQPDAETITLDGRRLGAIVRQSAERYRTPLAFPLMDLRLEKADLLALAGVDTDSVDTFHFPEAPSLETIARVRDCAGAPFARRNQAHFDAIAYIAGKTDLVPIGMAIGPFSLMTKLMADPITAIAMAGMGMTAEDDPSVLAVERSLALAEQAVARSLRAQARAGAKAITVCEPAASIAYLSPRQIDRGADIFERFVMEPLLRMKALFDELGVGLILHNCGELTRGFVEQFAQRVHPAVLSLGSSRKLWEDAAVTPKDVVLFGNLPTKSFYSDSVMSEERVRQMTCELLEHMRQAGHPFILGSECDVLHVPGSGETIRRKVGVFLECSCH